MIYDAIVLAAGSGTRSQLAYNKVLYPIEGRPLLGLSLDVFEADPDCRSIIIACKNEELTDFSTRFARSKTRFVCGGDTRQDSVLFALHAAKADYVLIHDGARPFVSAALVQRIKEALASHPSIVPAVDVVDSIKRVDENGYVIETPPRALLKAAQTPQGFARNLIVQALETARRDHLALTDDTQAVELCMHVPTLCIDGDPANFKVTSPQDLLRIRQGEPSRSNRTE